MNWCKVWKVIAANMAVLTKQEALKNATVTAAMEK
jgi:hypothetical protein